jgi:fumarate hydratase class I
LRNILDDKEASDNDKFVAFDFLKNANIAAGGVLPMCQDTGTAIIMGKKGRFRVSPTATTRRRARRGRARRLSAPQPALFAGGAAVDVRGEEHRQQHAGAVEIYAEGDDAYKFMFMAKGGGSANKSVFCSGDAVDADA